MDVHERVAQLEGRVEGHAQMLTDVAAAVRHLEVRVEHFEVRMEQRFTVLEGRLTALDEKLDRKVGVLEQKIGALDQKIGGVEMRLEQKLDSHFRWLVGIQFATLVTLVAALVAIAG